MNIFDTQLKSKTVGILILLSSLLVLILTITLSIFLIPFSLGSEVDILTFIPFLIITFFVLVISALGIYIGIRYLKEKGFKKNSSLGTLMIIIGSVYFVSTLTSYLFSNLTGNTGGWVQPIIAFLWAIITIPFGLVLKNGCK